MTDEVRPRIIKPTKGSIFIKWFHHGLVKTLAALECYSCENFWGEDQFLEALHNGSGGYVATDCDQPIGFIIYEFDGGETTVNILNMVVRPDYRRQGVGTMLLDKLIQSNAVTRRNYDIHAKVRESNLAAQLFLKKHDFEAIGVLKAYYQDKYEEEEDIEDAYELVRKASCKGD